MKNALAAGTSLHSIIYLFSIKQKVRYTSQAQYFEFSCHTIPSIPVKNILKTAGIKDILYT